jgi:hypothetical protein
MNERERDDIRQLFPIVNQPEFKQWFSTFLEVKITEQHKLLEQSEDPVALHRAQGAIAALKRLVYIKDDVRALGELKRD